MKSGPVTKSQNITQENQPVFKKKLPSTSVNFSSGNINKNLQNPCPYEIEDNPTLKIKKQTYKLLKILYIYILKNEILYYSWYN